MNKKFKSFLLLVCSVALVSSCNDSLNRDQNMPDIQPKVVYKGEVVSADLDLPLPMPEQKKDEKSSTRSFSLIKDGTGLIKINYERYADKPVTMNVYFALRKSGMQDSDVTYFSIPCKITKVGDKYRLRASGASFQMNNGSLDGDYYIQAITLGPNTNLQEQPDKSYNFELTVQKGGPTSEIENATNGRSLDMPLTTKWTKVNYDAQAKRININNLKFDPQGIIIKFLDIDKDLNLNEEIELKGVEIDAYGLCSSGTFKLGKLSNGNTINGGEDLMFEYKRGSGAKPDEFYKGGLNEYGWSYLDFDVTTQSGQHVKLQNNGSTGFYIYAMPYKESANSGATLECRLKYSTYQHHEDQINVTEKIIRTIIPKKLKSGTMVATAKVKFPKSDLMISEFYHFNSGSSNSSMIELYNPTNQDIDLRDYALMRLRTFTANGGPGLHPYDNFRGGRSVLLQPVYLDPSVPSGTLTSPDMNGNNYVDNSGANDRTLKYAYLYGTAENARNNYKLKPGECIVLCSEGIYKQIAGRTRDYSDYLPEGDQIWFKELQNLVLQKGGKCKYVVGVTNYFGNNDNNDAQYSEMSGTFTHGVQHIMILSKFVDKGKPTATSEFVDQAGPALDYMSKTDNFNDRDGWAKQTELYEKYISTFRLRDFRGPGSAGKRDDLTLIRRPGVVFPSPTEWIYNMDNINKDPYRDWDVWMTPYSTSGTTGGDENRQGYILPMLQRAVEKNNFGKRY